MGKKNYVCVPRDEYDELIEYKLHINALYEFITKKHASSIKAYGHKRETICMEAIELQSERRYFGCFLIETMSLKAIRILDRMMAESVFQP